MPVMDGFESTKRFRAWEEEQQATATAAGKTPKPRFLIVGMSANSDAQSKQNALDSGMDAFCPKPFNFKELEAVLVTKFPKVRNSERSIKENGRSPGMA